MNIYTKLWSKRDGDEWAKPPHPLHLFNKPDPITARTDALDVLRSLFKPCFGSELVRSRTIIARNPHIATNTATTTPMNIGSIVLNTVILVLFILRRTEAFLNWRHWVTVSAYLSHFNSDQLIHLNEFLDFLLVIKWLRTIKFNRNLITYN